MLNMNINSSFLINTKLKNKTRRKGPRRIQKRKYQSRRWGYKVLSKKNKN